MKTSQQSVKRINKKSEYYSIYIFLVGAWFGALTGASVMAWWLLGSLEDAPELAAYSSYLADAKNYSIKLTLGSAAVLLVVLACKVFSVMKAPKTDLAGA